MPNASSLTDASYSVDAYQGTVIQSIVNRRSPRQRIVFDKGEFYNDILSTGNDLSDPARPYGSAYKSTWSSATTYAIGDWVVLTGAYYVAKAASTNQTPPNTSFWTAMVPTLTTYRAAWSSATAYVAGDFITYQGQVFAAVGSSTNQTPLLTTFKLNSTYWAYVQAPVVNSQGAWNSATSYVLGDYVSYNGFYYAVNVAHSNQTPAVGQYWSQIQTQATSLYTFTAKGDCTNIQPYYTPTKIGAGSYTYPNNNDVTEFRATMHFVNYNLAANFGSSSTMTSAFFGLANPMSVQLKSGEQANFRTFWRVLPGEKVNLNRRQLVNDRSSDPIITASGGDSSNQAYASSTFGTMQVPSNYNFARQWGPAFIVGEYLGTPTPTAVLQGDSIPSGTGTTDGRSFIVRALQAAGWNTAIGSSPGSQLVSQRQCASVGNEMSLYADYTFLLGGTNDIGAGTGGALTYQALKDYAALLSQGGRKRVVVSTLLPRSGSSDSWKLAANQTPWGSGISSITASTTSDGGGGFLMRVAISGATAIGATGDTAYMSGIVGTGAVAALNGNSYTITNVNNSLYDLQGTTFGGTYSSAGLMSGTTRETARQFINGRLRDGTFAAEMAVLGVTVSVIDPCVQLEVNTLNVPMLNGGCWITNGSTTSYATVDGIHPNDTASNLAMASVVAANFPLYD